MDDSQGRIPDITLLSMQHLREHYPTVKISVEVENPRREGLQELAALADVVFYSKCWAQVRNLTPSSVSGSSQGSGKWL